METLDLPLGMSEESDQKGAAKMKKCDSCGKMVAEDNGLELTDGRFFCRSGGCQERFLIGVYECEVKPDLLRQGGVVIRSSAEPGFNPPSLTGEPAVIRVPMKKWWQFWK
jgi:hypothetical protein